MGIGVSSSVSSPTKKRSTTFGRGPGRKSYFKPSPIRDTRSSLGSRMTNRRPK